MTNKMQKVTKAVFPVAGLGTRFLPATKANPKEMLPIVDKPLIQYAVEEAVSAGIKEMIFVTSSSKRAIEDHFDSHFELEYTLSQQGKKDLLNIVKEIVPEGVQCIYIRQPKALGLGHAVLCARQVVGNQPFAVLLADDLVDSEQQTCLQQMLPIFEETGRSVLAVQTIDDDETEKYGVIQTDNWTNSHSGKVKSIIEKPKPSEAPSRLGVVGRYLLTPEIFNALDHCPPGKGGEIQLTDALSLLLKSQSLYATQYDGIRYDCGSKLGYLQATVAFGLKHPDVGQDFGQFLNSYQKQYLDMLENQPSSKQVDFM